MLKHGATFILCLYLISLIQLTSKAWAEQYVVQPKDTLSTIARKKISKSVYGKKGSLKKLIAFNAQLKNPNLIFPGQSINLSDNTDTSTSLADKSASRTIASTPPADADPTPVAEDNKPEELIKVGSWGFFADYASSKISSLDKSTNTTADLFSTSNLGLRVFWSQDFNEKYKSTLSAGIRRLTLAAPSIATFTNANPLLMKINAELKMKSTENLSLFTALGYDQEVNLTGINLTTIGVETARVPKFKLGADYDLTTLGAYVLGASATGELYFPGQTSSSLSTKFGNAFSVGAYLVLPLETKSLKASIHFESKTISTDRTKQTESSLVFGFGMSFPINVPKKTEEKDREVRSYDY